jgi:hypothetical protein
VVVTLGVCSSALAQESAPAPAAPKGAAPIPAATEEAPPPTQAPAAAPAPIYPVAPSRSLLEAELRSLEEQRAELSLGLPIALMIGGGAAMLLGGTVLLFAAMTDAICDDDYDSYSANCGGAADGVYVLGVGGIIGGAIALVAGFIILGDRAPERRALGVRIKQLRRELQARPIYGFLHSGGGGAGLHLRF